MARSRSGWTLRTPHSNESDSIAALHTSSWRRTYRGMMSDAFLDGSAFDNRRHVWRERLTVANPRQFVCVADLNATIVGLICAFADYDAVWGSYIDNLHVAPDMHRSGIGRALMRRASEWMCAVAPRRGVYLWVMERNTSARSFYDRLGARHAETLSLEDPGGGRAPNCRFVWNDPGTLLATIPAE
jgi:ribosomal protein S18 acetylase RimI-like enzyme